MGTPQPEVLAHKSVKIFLSHCGYGGVTDTILAGKPVLAYPGVSDQFENANILEREGAALIVNHDFSNLYENTLEIIESIKRFSKKAKYLGNSLKSLGGLKKAIQIIEMTAAGQAENIVKDPEVEAKLSEIDEFFNTPQNFEKILALAISVLFFIILPVGVVYCFCRCCCWCCCGCGRRSKRGKGKNLDEGKNTR